MTQQHIGLLVDRYDAMVEWCDRTLGWCALVCVFDCGLLLSTEYCAKTDTLSFRNRDREQTDLKLKPAIEAQQQRQQQGTQQRLSQYFEPSRRVASIRSVRMANAVQKLGDRTGGGTGADIRSAHEAVEPRASDDTPLDAAATLIQKQKEIKAAAAPAKKRPKTKKNKANGDGSPKSTRGRSGYMIFLCVQPFHHALIF